MIEAGQRASVVAAAIHQDVNRHIEMTVTQLINHYRTGEMNHDYIIGKLGEIAGLHSLMDNLENIQNRAALAAQKEYGDGS